LNSASAGDLCWLLSISVQNSGSKHILQETFTSPTDAYIVKKKNG
jgi:hypothetical protein